MHYKRFEFLKKDKKFLKKNAISLLFYAILFLTIFILQFLLFIKEDSAQSITILKGSIGLCVMLSTIILATISILLAGKDFNSIIEIKKTAHSVRQVFVIKNTDNLGIMNMYSIINKVIAIITLILSASAVTYAVLDWVYNSVTMFYLPLVLAISISSFSSANFLNNQIKISKTVNNYYDNL